MITRSNVNHPDVSGHCFYDNSPKSGLTCHSKMLSCLIIIQNLDSNVLIMLFEEARRHIIALVIHTHTHTRFKQNTNVKVLGPLNCSFEEQKAVLS